jgi:WD40-like Beta Propeller Repeat
MRFTNVLTLLFTLAAMSLDSAATKEASKVPGGQRPLKQYSMEQFTATTTFSGASFSADGKRILVSSNESGIFNAFSVPVTGGKAEALTKSTTDSTFAVSYFPNDNRILYTRDAGGNEQNHL